MSLGNVPGMDLHAESNPEDLAALRTVLLEEVARTGLIQR